MCCLAAAAALCSAPDSDVACVRGSAQDPPLPTGLCSCKPQPDSGDVCTCRATALLSKRLAEQLMCSYRGPVALQMLLAAAAI